MDYPDKYRVDEEPTFKPQSFNKSRPSRKKLYIWLAIGLLIILLALGTWIIADHKHPKPKGHVGSASIIVTPSNNSSAAIVKYVSNGSDLNLSFMYPKNWSVSPASNDNPNDHTITLTSPLTNIINSADASVVGKVIVEVRPGSDNVSELNTNSPIIALNSTQIGYSEPTANQAVYPYISYIHFSNGSSVAGSFEEVIITGSEAFSLGEPISAEYLSGLDPIISASFYTCVTQSCVRSNQTLLSISSDTWQNTSFFQQVLTVFESFELN